MEKPLGVPEPGEAGGPEPEHRRKRRHVPVGMPIAALLALCLVGFVGWAVVVDDPTGGEPTAVVALPPGTIPATPNGAAPASEPGGAAAPADKPGADKPGTGQPGTGQKGAAPAAPAGGQTVTIIDGSTGKRQQVSVGAGESKAEAAGDGKADGKPSGQKPDVKVAAVEQSLLEATRHGHVPRIALDGTRPSVAYARKGPPASEAAVRVALVVGGLGVGSSGSAKALEKLPPVVSLAFVPYGTEVGPLAAKARGQGHEILLQLPMEPFDYPDNDPGPQTLLTSLTPEQNVDRMQWAMSRMQGYVGVVNYMGGRFTSTETAIGPVLREVAKRGLVYIDDGTSPRSLASQFAGANNLPFAKAAVVIDAVPSNAEIDRALARLETTARETGSAVGIARALPLSIERLTQWIKQAEGRGIVLVPITAITARAKAS
nr:divergent polysaccharide deacetylase family protein [Rhodoplanes elegans]